MLRLFKFLYISKFIIDENVYLKWEERDDVTRDATQLANRGAV